MTTTPSGDSPTSPAAVAEAAGRRLSERLPAVKEYRLRPWSVSYGGDYYGALDVAAEYCGLARVPERLPGNWQHGTIPPWHRFRPEVVVYGAPPSVRCFVARPDEEMFLREGGYPNARAIGLPILYTRHSGQQRIPNSLLVMPTHSLASDVMLPSCEEYVREIASIQNRFSVVAACVSAYCLSKGLWAPQFADHGIASVRGAGIADANALRRIRTLFDMFEYVTTDSYGSHVFYALYCGAKVSIWGTATPVFRENVMKDGGWGPYPDAVDKLFSPETERNAEVFLGPLRVDPWKAIPGEDLGASMIGAACRLSPAEMRRLFGWTPLIRAQEAVIRGIRSSQLAPAARYLKRRLSPGITKANA